MQLDSKSSETGHERDQDGGQPTRVLRKAPAETCEIIDSDECQTHYWYGEMPELTPPAIEALQDDRQEQPRGSVPIFVLLLTCSALLLVLLYLFARLLWL